MEVEAEAAGAATDDDSTDAANATTETNPTTTGGDGLSRIANGEAQTLGKVFKISLKFYTLDVGVLALNIDWPV